MKRLLLVLLFVTVLSTSLSAATLGLYFDFWPGEMAYAPTPTTVFEMYMYLHAADYYVTALEYQLTTPLDPPHTLFIIISWELGDLAVVELGEPWLGHSIAFWPPLNGYAPGYNMICKYTCMTLAPCGYDMADYPIVVGPHPESGFVRGTYYPNNETFSILGLTSIVCPEFVGVEETSWGAIKNLFE